MNLSLAPPSFQWLPLPSFVSFFPGKHPVVPVSAFSLTDRKTSSELHPTAQASQQLFLGAAAKYRETWNRYRGLDAVCSLGVLSSDSLFPDWAQRLYLVPVEEVKETK